MRCLALFVCLIAACSNGAKREDASTTMMPATKPPGSPAPKVVLETGQGEATVTVEIVATEAKIQRGLMYREHLPPDDGMLFLMGYERDHTFYMRNTLIPLDMIFITKDLTVAGFVERAEPRTEKLRSVGVPSLYVLEVNGGWAAAHKLAPGAKVKFVGVTP
ncbi:MAG: hypothetical protein JWP01_1796 [Myxococcales bacterium]|nr:hypothetical protein [Myxococcales bacterium]